MKTCKRKIVHNLHAIIFNYIYVNLVFFNIILVAVAKMPHTNIEQKKKKINLFIYCVYNNPECC